MAGFFETVENAIDNFSDFLTKNTSSLKKTQLYSFEDFKNYLNKQRKEQNKFGGCKISVQIRNEFEDMVFTENKFVIRIVIVDTEKNPIYYDNKKDSYVGTLIVANEIDKKLRDFMDGKEEKLILLGGK